ncbi:MAG: toll/interleukin-1 receptor domain-containing protein [Sulfuriflexus sp.]|nr:toll/interleukin-1 receptor domain-containing protein [Sulfuriflexus sp.]
MGTVRDYYESDNRDISAQNALSIYSPQGIEIGHTISVKVHPMVEAHSKYISIYSGKEVAFEALIKHLENEIIRACDINGLMGQKESADMEISINGGDVVSAKDLVFSKKTILYVDCELSDDRKNLLKSHGESQGLRIEVRDTSYADERSKKERPLAFISHSKNDSRDFSIKLANELSRLGCPVWFDEYSLNIGDSLVESIDAGLKVTDKCIFVLSPEFLANEGWCKYEFKAASMKQIFEKKNIMLPIWHGIRKEDVYEYSAALVDTVGLDSSLGVTQIATKISKVLLGS